MLGWLIKKYLKKHLHIKIQYWLMSENVQVFLLLDDETISTSSAKLYFK